MVVNAFLYSSNELVSETLPWRVDTTRALLLLIYSVFLLVIRAMDRIFSYLESSCSLGLIS